ncbi:hypothetical protein PN836_018835 [Ningiella sp. W23]|uniref:hypothetical protein n=1 Tax=Ningiella sp. W23 TaxID=3023715 RepID=UPI003758179C
MSHDQNKQAKTLSKKVRLIIGILSIPSLILTAMLLKLALDGQQDSIGFFELTYAVVGIFAAYIALTGKRFFL